MSAGEGKTPEEVVLGCTPGEAALLAQGHYSCWREVTWSKKVYKLDIRQRRFDMIAAAWEDVRDQIAIIFSEIDNLVLVSVLFLTFAYGFMCEGTFPKSESKGTEYPGIQQLVLDAYAWLLSLSVVFQLLALMVAIFVRLEAESCFKALCSDFHPFLQQALGAVAMGAEGGTGDEPSVDANLVARLVDGLEREVHERMPLYFAVFGFVRPLIFIGALSLTLLSCCLVFLVFDHRFPSTPMVWRVYCGTLCIGAPNCVLVAVYVHRDILKTTPGARRVARSQAWAG